MSQVNQLIDHNPETLLVHELIMNVRREWRTMPTSREDLRKAIDCLLILRDRQGLLSDSELDQIIKNYRYSKSANSWKYKGPPKTTLGVYAGIDSRARQDWEAVAAQRRPGAFQLPKPSPSFQSFASPLSSRQSVAQSPTGGSFLEMSPSPPGSNSPRQLFGGANSPPFGSPPSRTFSPPPPPPTAPVLPPFAQPISRRASVTNSGRSTPLPPPVIGGGWPSSELFSGRSTPVPRGSTPAPNFDNPLEPEVEMRGRSRFRFPTPGASQSFGFSSGTLPQANTLGLTSTDPVWSSPPQPQTSSGGGRSRRNSGAPARPMSPGAPPLVPWAFKSLGSSPFQVLPRKRSHIAE